MPQLTLSMYFPFVSNRSKSSFICAGALSLLVPVAFPSLTHALPEAISSLLTRKRWQDNRRTLLMRKSRSLNPFSEADLFKSKDLFSVFQTFLQSILHCILVIEYIFQLNTTVY